MVWLTITGLQNLTWYQSCKINLHPILWPQKLLLLLSPSTPWFTWLLSNYPPPISFSGVVKLSLYCSVKNCMDILMAQHQCHLLPLSLQLTTCGNNWISSSWAFCFLLLQKKLSLLLSVLQLQEMSGTLLKIHSAKSLKLVSSKLRMSFISWGVALVASLNILEFLKLIVINYQQWDVQLKILIRCIGIYVV